MSSVVFLAMPPTTPVPTGADLCRLHRLFSMALELRNRAPHLIAHDCKNGGLAGIFECWIHTAAVGRGGSPRCRRRFAVAVIVEARRAQGFTITAPPTTMALFLLPLLSCVSLPSLYLFEKRRKSQQREEREERETREKEREKRERERERE